MKVWNKEEIAEFSSRLAGMLDAGIPLLQSLDILTDQMGGKRKACIIRVKSGIEQGLTLKEAFEAGLFPPLFVSLVSLAEMHGKLADTLKLISEWYRRQFILSKHVKRKISYPVFIFLLLFILLAYLTFYLLPRIESLLLSFHQDLPPSTQTLFSITSFLQQYSSHLMLTMLLLLCGGFLAGRMLHRQNRLVPVLLAIPGLRSLMQIRYTYFFSSQLGLLLEAGMGILQALEVIRSHSPYHFLNTGISQIEKEILEGKPLSAIKLDRPLLAKEFYRMSALGESQGTVGAHLLMCSNLMEQKINNRVQFFIRWFEPFVILAAGGLIGFVIFAVFIPMLQLIQSI